MEENEELKKKAKAHDIIIRVELDFYLFKISKSVEEYNKCFIIHKNKLTEEEWNFLKKMLEGK